MADANLPIGQVEMAAFKPEDRSACVPAWQDYKREFRIRLVAAGLKTADGERQVGNLLKCMGIEAMKLYDTFCWTPTVEAVVANPENNNQHVQQCLEKTSTILSMCLRSLTIIGECKNTDH